MAWMRVSDTAAMYPPLLAIAEHPDADDRTVDEVFGWWTRLATLSAQHLTDYVVTFGVVLTVSGSKARADRLIALAVFAGLLTEVDLEGRRGVKLLDDPEFVHLKTADEIAWEKQRREDNGNPAITVLVRLRDGDACRYCGRVVRFTARRGKLAGTYDHRPPGEPADAERSVVSCAECNARRGNAPLEVADAAVPLLPPPSEPYFHRGTRTWLNGYTALLTENGLTPPPLVGEDVTDMKSGTELRRAPQAPAQTAQAATTRRATPAPQAAITRREDITAQAASSRRATPTEHRSDGVLTEPVKFRQVAGVRQTETPGRDGTGRVGPARVGPVLDGTARSTLPSSERSGSRRRGRRGGRNRQNQQRGTT